MELKTQRRRRNAKCSSSHRSSPKATPRQANTNIVSSGLCEKKARGKQAPHPFCYSAKFRSCLRDSSELLPNKGVAFVNSRELLLLVVGSPLKGEELLRCRLDCVNFINSFERKVRSLIAIMRGCQTNNIIIILCILYKTP
jgi:hypothetical protein